MTHFPKPSITDNTILVFDKDGVIFHSEDFKFEYFFDLFQEFSEHQEQIKSYLVGSGGTPRKARFQTICSDIIQMNDADDFVEELMQKSFTEMDPEILNVDFVEGAREFIVEHSENKKFVCSGSSQNEVNLHLKRHNLDNLFVELHGGVKRKSDVLLSIKNRFGTDMVFFGDTMVDYNASLEAQVPFVGLRTSKYHDPFSELGVCKIYSFSEL
ncbi:HAD-IA family hydrolase [Reichenbachiella sp. MALMAid0571]|uniref:HAD family hydrolase n=1 Tax=Reichenbachiella sp. MALMAid0571 TaxID=3143939 RepID=UPI0032DFBE60